MLFPSFLLFFPFLSLRHGLLGHAQWCHICPPLKLTYLGTNYGVQLQVSAEDDFILSIKIEREMKGDRRKRERQRDEEVSGYLEKEIYIDLLCYEKKIKS